MITTLRRTLPPRIVLISFLILYVPIAALSYFLAVTRPLLPNNDFPRVDLWRIGVVLLASFAYGAYRVISAFPAFTFSYLQWLQLTPWTPRRQLPFGPPYVQLIWADLLLVGGLMVLEWGTPTVGEMWISSFVLLGASVAVMVLLASTEEWGPFYVLAAGAAVTARLWESPPWFAAAALGMYVVSLWGLDRALARYPWTPRINQRFQGAQRRRPNVIGGSGYLVTNTTPLRASAPFTQLAPQRTGPGVPLSHNIAIAVVMAIWTYTAATVEVAETERSMWWLLGVGAGIWVVVLRWMVYVAGYFPPISLWGRLRHRILVIPGYDRILVAPVLILMATFGVVLVTRWLGGSSPLALALGVATIILLVMRIKPSYETWRLTGHHRILRWAPSEPLNSPDRPRQSVAGEERSA